MKTRELATVLILASAATLSAQTPARPQVTPSSVPTGVTVSGTVVAVGPAKPSTDAPRTVIAVPTPDARRRGFVTLSAPVDPDNRFTFRNVAPGPYRLNLDRGGDGMHPVVIDVGATAVSGIRLNRVASVPVTLTCVVDEGGTLPSIVTFQAVGEGDWSLFTPFDPRTPRTTSLPAGTYPVVIAVPAGYYVHSVRAGALDLFQQPLTVDPDGEPVTVTVKVRQGSSPPAGTGRVSGRVPGAHEGMEVELVDATGGQPRRIGGRTTTGPDGAFAFTGLRPGMYELNLPPARRVVVGIAVLGSNVDIDVPDVSGSIFAGASVMVLNEAGRPSGYWPGPIALAVEAGDVRRSFPIHVQGFWGSLPPGSYRVRVDGLPGDFHVASLTAGSVDLLQRPFSVPAGRPAETVTLVLQADPPR
jgi:hypothetical protein